MEICEQYTSGKGLTRQHRIDLFRGLVSYLHLFVENELYSGMLEKEVTNITVQSIAQLMVDCSENPEIDSIPFLIEPVEREFSLNSLIIRHSIIFHLSSN